MGPKSNSERTKEELNKNEPAREPIDNEIPDSVNVRANLAPGANVPGAVENEHESRHQLNLGKYQSLSSRVSSDVECDQSLGLKSTG